ncbi:hypothetical protein [Sodalis-like endosymbiont of Proechinophthirus fluctus]|uniref:hypothetical protein n=1 Tax=Sodalis-like endosymbiont of Proechinophthirus fluctus TaxID=1462730 RepID=UPI0016505E53|nr:hypothetical protein [Sodalis-like endosymbiont of Proechinophthirus fluctus]
MSYSRRNNVIKGGALRKTNVAPRDFLAAACDIAFKASMRQCEVSQPRASLLSTPMYVVTA